MFPKSGGQITSNKIADFFPESFNDDGCERVRYLCEKHSEPNKLNELNELKRKTAYKLMVMKKFKSMILELLDKKDLLPDYLIVFGEYQSKYEYLIIPKTTIDLDKMRKCVENLKLTRKFDKKYETDAGEKLIPTADMTAYISAPKIGHPKTKIVTFSVKANRDSCNVSFMIPAMIREACNCPVLRRKVRAMLPVTKYDDTNEDEKTLYIFLSH